MGTNYIAPIWRMPINANKDKLSNYSIDFDGVANEYIDCALDGTGGSSSSFGSGSDLDLTISFWFKLSQLTTSFGMLSWATSPAAGGGLLFFVQQTNVGTVRVYIVANGAGYRYVSSTLSVDTWYNLTFTRTASDNTWRFYLNSTLDSTTYTDNGSVSGQSSATNFYIGSGFSGSGNFNGSISQVSVFNYALDSPQVSYLYNLNNPMAISGAEPIAYWPLGDNSNPNAPGSFPNISVGADSVFDFVPNDYINLNSDILFNTNEGFTFSSWVNLDSYSDPYPYLANLKTNVTDGIGIFISNNSSYAGVNVGSTDSSITKGRTTGDISSTFLNSWNNVVVTYNGNGANTLSNFSIYVNGLPVALTTTGNYSTMPNTANNIGRRSNSYHYLDGKLSNVAIWNSDQSSEISNIYNSGVPATTYTNTPTVWYKLNQSANWEADTANNWQIPDNRSAYPQSFNFNGSSDYIDAGSQNELKNINALSISIWFNYDSIATSADGLVSRDSLTRVDGNWYVALDSNQIRFLLKTANGQDALNSSTISANRWYHTLCVWNGTTMKIYLNGDVSNSITLSNATGTLGSASDNVIIGRRLDYGNLSGFLNGNASNVAIWNSDQSAEISNIYNNGTPATSYTNNPVVWYKLDNTSIWNPAPANYWTFLNAADENNSGALNFSN